MLQVALLAEGVDRNKITADEQPFAGSVALLAEGVDRNVANMVKIALEVMSPSSRRAWIEICRQ